MAKNYQKEPPQRQPKHQSYRKIRKSPDISSRQFHLFLNVSAVLCFYVVMIKILKISFICDCKSNTIIDLNQIFSAFLRKKHVNVCEIWPGRMDFSAIFAPNCANCAHSNTVHFWAGTHIQSPSFSHPHKFPQVLGTIKILKSSSIIL